MSKKLTFKKREAIQLHRQMWRKLSRNGKREKPEIGHRTDCYLCWYAEEVQKIYGGHKCQYCPVTWPKGALGRYLCIEGGLYSQWRRMRDMRKRKVIAKQIAELPERSIFNRNRK